MKRILIIYCVFIFLIFNVSALPLFPNPGVANTEYNYTFNFTLNSDCSGVLISNSTTITTNSKGYGFIDLDISSLSSIPNYLCEYRDGSLRKVHELSDQTFRNIFVNNIKSNNWTNVSITENQISDLQSYLLETDQRYNETQLILDNNSSWSSTFNSTYDTWLPNYTIYSPFWYNHTLISIDWVVAQSYLTSYTETDPIFLAENSTIWGGINSAGNSSFNQSLTDTLYHPLENQRVSTANDVTFNSVNSSKFKSDATQMIIENENYQGSSATGKIQYKGIYQPTSGTPTSTIGNYFNGTIDIDGVTSGGSSQTYIGNVFESKIDTHASTSPFPTINYIGTSFPNRITGHQSGAAFWAGQITGVNYDVDIDGTYASVAGINFFPMTIDVDYTASTSASHQMSGLELTSTYNTANTVNQIYGIKTTAEALGTTKVNGNLNPYRADMQVDSGVTLNSHAIGFQSVLSDEVDFNNTLATGKKVLGFATIGSIFNMDGRETNAFYTDLQADTNNYAFKSDYAKSYFRDTQVDGVLTIGNNGVGGLTAGDINASTIYYDTLTAKSPEYIKSDSGLGVDKNGYPVFVECKEDAETGMVFGIEWKYDPSVWNKIKDVVGIDYNPNYIYEATLNHPSCVSKKERIDAKKQAIAEYENAKKECESDERMKFNTPSEYMEDGSDCNVNLAYYEGLCQKNSNKNIFDREKLLCVNTNAKSESEAIIFDVNEEINQLQLKGKK